MVSKKKARSIARRDTIARRKQGKGQQQQATKKSEKQIAPKPSSLTQSKWVPCGHGWDKSKYPESHDCNKFIDLVIEKLDRRPLKDHKILDAVVFPAMKTAGSKYPEVWKDVTKLEWIASALISLGVQDVVNGDGGSFPYFAATFAECTRQKISALEINEAVVLKDFRYVYTQRLDELLNIDERRVIGYLKKRIPCSCLDEKYKEVKHLPKKGICFGCSARTEVSEMWSCGGCRREHYCSEKCQADRWQYHQEDCLTLKDP